MTRTAIIPGIVSTPSDVLLKKAPRFPLGVLEVALQCSEDSTPVSLAVSLNKLYPRSRYAGANTGSCLFSGDAEINDGAST